MGPRQERGYATNSRITIALGIVFVVSIAVLSVSYGFFAERYRFFPYSLFDDADKGLNALLAVEDDALMIGLIAKDPLAPTVPKVTRFQPDAGTERLLVVGGFYQRMDRCPRFGCLAWVISRDGTVLHSWEVDPEELWAGLEGFHGPVRDQNFYPIGAALDPDGQLILTFHARNLFPYAVGIAKFSADGHVLWKRFDHAHHWIDVDADGRIFAPSMELRKNSNFAGTAVEARCSAGIRYFDGIRIYARDGSVLHDLWIEDSLIKSGYPGLVYGLRDGCDPLHVNSVQVIAPEIAEKIPGVNAGDLLVSIREASAIVILEPNGRIKHLVAGLTAAQHGPQFLPDGSVAVFDNQGGNRETGGSRILRIDMVTGATSVIFPRQTQGPGLPFFSSDGGHLDVSPDGRRIMITSKKQSRTMEIDIESGEVLWMMETGFDLSRYFEQRPALSTKTTRGWFYVYGAYYLKDSDVIR
jgi:hypothetical protein